MSSALLGLLSHTSSTAQFPPQKAAAEAVAQANGTIYALFMEVSTIHALIIDAGSGSIRSQKRVTGFDNWGEITRVFMWDEVGPGSPFELAGDSASLSARRRR